MNPSNPQTPGPRVVTDCADIRMAVMQLRSEGKSIGLVPTMGALHAGHLSLIAASNAQCDATVVTIFVNPTQFGPNDDYDRYRRDLEDDLAAMAGYRVDLVFAPDPAEMYPPSMSTYVEPPRVAEPLEGQCRPGHFRGVTTVVLKLFNLIPADAAFFGQKDYQQTLAIRRMVEDLNVPIDVRACPIIREADGLAMSSRNAYMSADERRRALALSQCLDRAARLADRGETDAATILAAMRQTLQTAGIDRIDYVALVEPDTLEPVQTLDGPAVAAIAAFVGTTRLIDNRRIE